MFSGSFYTRANSPTVPPFPAGSARNGLSVDAGGFIVLGGPLGAPALLLDDREISLNAFALWVSWATGFPALFFDPVSVVVNLGDFQTFAGGVYLNIDNGAPNQLMKARGPAGSMMELDFTTGVVQIGDLAGVGGNNIVLVVNGSQGDAQISGLGASVADFDLLNRETKLGDISVSGNGLVETINDAAGSHDVSNTAGNAVYSVNGNAGASGTFTTTDGKTVTVVGGIVTSIV